MKHIFVCALFAALGAAACSKNDTPTTPSQSCAYTVSSTSQSPAASGGAFSVTITRTSGSCTWAASSNASWVTFTNNASGSDTGTLSVAVAPNTTTTARAAAISVSWTGGNAQIAVNQAGLAFGECTYAFANPSLSIPAESSASSAALAVTGSGCSWNASTDAAWLTITSQTSGVASAAIAFTATANPDVSARAGSINVTFAGGSTKATITQAGVTTCTYTLTPSSQSVTAAGGSFSFTPVRNTPNGCSWAASTDTPWITLTGPTSGLSNVPVPYTVAANGTGSARSGRITVIWSGGNLDFAVNQQP
jgi:trimeric autotransporter adhesin